MTAVQTVYPENRATQALHILVVDDDPLLHRTLEKVFVGYNCAVSFLHDGAEVERYLRELSPDIVLLDLILPEEDGFSVLQRIRAMSTVPVIILTGQDEDMDRIVGLELGADDYITKPFHTRELFARVKAVLRRTHDDWRCRREDEAESPEGVLTTGGVSLDCARWELRRQGRARTLATTEFLLVRTFMRHAGEVLSKEDILALSFGDNHLATDRSIDVHINRLRKVLTEIGDGQARIRSVGNEGYSWSAET